MTLSLEKFSQSSAVLQQYNATWEDYVQVRDRIDWNKIAILNMV